MTDVTQVEDGVILDEAPAYFAVEFEGCNRIVIPWLQL